MAVTPILPSPSQTTPGIANRQGDAPAEPGESRSILSSDFETFLQMLTAQAKYQDPLEPIDSSEYAAQLAQFSMVEQQVKTNELMSDLIGSGSSTGIAGIANWIGRDALTISPVAFDGTPVTVLPQSAAGAEQIVLVVSDAQGNVVQRQSMTPTDQPVQWAGVADNGAPFTPGEYSFEIESRSKGEVLAIEKARTYTRVTEARLDNGETLLLLDSGYLVRSSDVLGLRDPA